VIFYGSALASTDEIPSSAPVVILPLWCAGVVALADAVRSRRALIAATNERIRVAEETRERETRQRVVEERLTIARDLHDLVGHHLSVMMVQTGVAAHVLRSDPDRAESALGLARDSGRSVMDELRDLLSVLRDGEGEPTERVPTIDDIHALVDATRAMGVAVQWTERGAPLPLSPATSVATYRALQELLTNARRHGAGAVGVDATWSDHDLTVTVRNPIADTRVPGSGLGLVGLRERVTHAGGTIAVDETTAEFVVAVTLPALAGAPA
jgi:signal transduction histidine kinase